MKEKELRLALVCYGGVSLAIYMHGITKEIWKLLKASDVYHAQGIAERQTRTFAEASPADSRADSEHVYYKLLQRIGEKLSLRVMVDIVAGASAGGINGIFLSHAIAGGHSMEPLRDLWLAQGDVEKLLDPRAAATKFSKFYLMPVIWGINYWRSGRVDELVGHSATLEVRQKLSRFLRSRWFEPPFSGVTFTRMLYNALDLMSAETLGEPLLPPGHPLDLFVTVTDYYGYPQRLRLNSPAEIVEREHRLVISFHDHGRNAERRLGDLAELTFAARATSSYPGAFPPAQVGEVDQVLMERGRSWPTRTEFLRRTLPEVLRSGGNPRTVALIDGSVLNNKPFGEAIGALRSRPAHREVDRRIVYIEPTPRRSQPRPTDRPPGFFATIIRSLSDIPRNQPIRDDLEWIENFSRRVRRLRRVTEVMISDVEHAVDKAIGSRFSLENLNADTLTQWRVLAHEAAADASGYVYGSYAELKLTQVIEDLIKVISQLGGQAAQPQRVRDLRGAIWDWIEHEDIAPRLDEHGSRNLSDHEPWIDFLRRFDLSFRIRRIRYIIRQLNMLYETDAAPFEEIDEAKGELYEALAPLLDLRRVDRYSADLRGLAAEAEQHAAPIMEALGAQYGLTDIDDFVEARLLATLGKATNDTIRRTIALSYVGFSFYDVAALPLLQGEGLDEFDGINVDRISPEDATAIREGGPEASLKGIEFATFGAFFSRTYRENDYLWGRLHGIDRLIDIVLSATKAEDRPPEKDVLKLKYEAFRLVLDAEEPHLKRVTELIHSLRQEIDEKAAALG